MVKRFFAIQLLAISFLAGKNMVQVKLKDGSTIGGEFIGTYMQHVHLLTGEDINYFKCDNIQFVTKTDDLNAFEYDCSENTISADILFPPQLNPMTGEWETVIPSVFNPRKEKVLAKEEELAKLKKRNSEDKKIRENSTKHPGFNTVEVLEEQLEKTKNNFQKVIDTKVKPALSNAFYEDAKEKHYPNKTQTNEKAISSPFTTNSVSNPQKGIKKELTTYHYEDGLISFSEDEIRKLIKREVRKELRKALPYEIKKHKEQSQNRLFQNILFGCGAWFLFMMLLSF